MTERDLLDTEAAGAAALRGGALRTVGYVVGIGLALASAPLLIRHLGQVGFGRYTTVVSLVTIVAGVTEVGLNTIALREYAVRVGAERDRLMANVLGIRIAFTTAGVLAAIAFAALAGYDETLILGTAVAGAGMFIQLLQGITAVPLQGGLRFGWVVVADLTRQVVLVAGIVALVVVGAGVVGFLAAAIPAAVVSLGMTAWLARRLMPLRPAFDVSTWGPLLRDTLPYAAAVALNVLYFRLTIILMSLIADEVETGYFSTSFRIVEILIGLPALVIGAAFPILARADRDDPERFARASGRIFELAAIAGAWLVMCLELGAGFAIDVLGGENAEPATAVLRIQGIAVAATFIAVACGYPLLSLRRHAALVIANVAALVATVTLTLALVPAHQARGAAIATVAAEVALAVANSVLLLRSRAGASLPLSALLVALVAALAGGAAGALVGIHPVVQVVVASVVFAAVLRALGRFPDELREALGR